ncbi:DUF3224 domain-containing protein [Ideonella sp. DXS29W]|uniref:DUF3224 domain-containing protein n=1 Tax=Ideonella lacteola TaxID=2984193 RepID=A0ABU9BQ87_9BURK
MPASTFTRARTRRRMLRATAALAVSPCLIGTPAVNATPSNANTPAPSTAPTNPPTATGQFEVKIGPPEPMVTPADAPAIGRRRLDKTYRGDLQGSALGEMVFAGQPQAGEAAYTALESFVGTLHGRSGGLALAHLGVMHAGGQEVRILIVPGSGTGELAGIQGELLLRIESGVHHYTLNYQFN